MRKYIIINFILVLSFIVLAANENKDSFIPQINPGLSITKTFANITVDGVLDDEGWKNAASVTGFAETHPGDQTKPVVKTEVKITYDANNLYVAFICEDNPDEIRASLRDRDEIWSDDYVGILLDTYGDASWALYIFSNPLGIQGDTHFSSTIGEDDSFDMIYQSEGKITAEGYQVEMAIPFSSLRFPDNPEQEWRVNFWRTHPRDSRRTYSWAALSRDEPCFLCQYGTLSGIKNVQPGKSLELLPSVIANQTGALKDYDNPNSGFKNENIDGEASLSLKWAVTPSLTVEGAYNPDFSQVESDVDQIDINNTFALYYPEKRPFFQEGSDLFKTWHRIVYTRAINDPIVASKIIGRWNRNTLAYLGAVDENSLLVIPLEEKSMKIP
ncbi:MAG: carbohydrate binding family 9 domain-containing protein, partial [Calditrichia bacterium]|nr:carbohydrate binding family 9 domain-containing protein [Calditrichia bacterium]